MNFERFARGIERIQLLVDNNNTLIEIYEKYKVFRFAGAEDVFEQSEYLYASDTDAALRACVAAIETLVGEKTFDNLRVLWHVGSNSVLLIGLKSNGSKLDAPVCVRLHRYQNSVKYVATGGIDLVDLIGSTVSNAVKANGCLMTELSIGATNEIRYNFKYVHPRKRNVAKNCFYPFLPTNIGTYFRSFLKSPAPVLLLIGPPGTGKSTFIRTVALRYAKEMMIAYQPDVVTHTELLGTYASADATILALEDVDFFLKPREDNNPFMSGFLNATQGLMDHHGKKKFIFSTNLPSVRDVDPALIRPGRCYDVLEFRYLQPDEAQEVLVQMNMPPRTFTGPVSLAEVLNPPPQFSSKQTHKRARIGFTG